MEDVIKINGDVVNNIRFAHVTVLITYSQEALLRLIDRISTEYIKYKIKIERFLLTSHFNWY